MTKSNIHSFDARIACRDPDDGTTRLRFRSDHFRVGSARNKLAQIEMILGSISMQEQQ